MHPKPCFVRGAGACFNQLEQPPEQAAALRLGPDKKSVTLVDSPDAGWADALEAALPPSS